MTWLVIGALVVGLSLGVFGSGGSILTVPVLVYLLHHEDKAAIAESLGIVGAIALISALPYARERLVDWRTAVLFGVPGMAGTYGGAWLGGLVSGAVQLIVFAGVMLAAAGLMWRGGAATATSEPTGASDEEHRGGGRDHAPGDAVAVTGGTTGAEDASGAEDAPDAPNAPGAATTPATPVAPAAGRPALPVVVLEGLAVGVLTGFVGVGGGFLIVPALVLLGGLSMRRAVATSLVIIALKSATGFWKYLHVLEDTGSSVNWRTMAAFTVVGALGSMGGTFINTRLDAGALRRGFAAFLLVMAIFILGREGATLIGGAPAAETAADPGASASVEGAASAGTVEPAARPVRAPEAGP